MLSFQTLDSYKLAIEFVALALEIIRLVPRVHADDIDQLRRSAKSTARNIAEGAGRASDADKAHHYTVARGEAMESACSLDVMRAEGVVTSDRHQRGTELLERIVSILTKTIMNLRDRH